LKFCEVNSHAFMHTRARTRTQTHTHTFLSVITAPSTEVFYRESLHPPDKRQ